MDGGSSSAGRDADDGLSKVLPIHVSRYYLWDNSEQKLPFVLKKAVE